MANSWTSLSGRIDGLPLILCGPILRRVEKDSVSVFVAIKEEKTVTLEILDSAYKTINTSSTDNTPPEKNFLLKIGEKLFVTTITVKLSGSLLQPSNIYFYNLKFDADPMINPVSGIMINGILVSDAYDLPGITYSDYKFPSFTLPAEDINDLRFVHGSCRKPHGGGKDALTILDSILDNACKPIQDIKNAVDKGKGNENLKDRPQFACFTGDQIYADDVADFLLFMLMDANDSIIQIGEKLPGLKLKEETNKDELTKPGKRLELVAPKPDKANHGRLSSPKGKSHLMYLGEYYAMYLFVWSDVLWIEIPDAFDYKKALFHSIGEDKRMKGKYRSSDPIPWDKEESKIFPFYRNLKTIRKILANIPNYMIFDDHEVTDDWFITKKWSEYALESDSLGRRIIQNGLSAAAVFQAWGNTPDEFEEVDPHDIQSSPRAIIEELIPDSSRQKNSEKIDFESNELTALLPKFIDGENKLSFGYDWFFVIDSFTNFRLIFLNTRTRREWVNGNISPPSLIRYDQLEEQLPEFQDEKEKLTLLVSAAPVIGNYVIEEFVQEKVLYRFLIVKRLFERTRKESALQEVDKEAWVLDRVCLEKLLDRISTYKKVIILSGDVHYAFSAEVNYSNLRNGKNADASIVQLCSSSLRNSGFLSKAPSWKTIRPHKYSVAGLQFKEGETVKFFNSSPIASVDKAIRVYPDSPVHEYRSSEKFEPKQCDYCSMPDWEYEVNYIKEERSVEKGPNRLEDLNQKGELHKTITSYEKNRTVVGVSNLGVVSFNEFKVTHDLWYYDSKDSKDDSKIFAKHVLSLEAQSIKKKT